MTAWRLYSAEGTLFLNGGEEYIPIFGSEAKNLARDTDAEVSAKAYIAYTFSDLRVWATLDGPTSTVNFRDDESSVTALAVSITGSGWFETIASASVAADSLINYEINSSGQMHGDSINTHSVLITYEHGSTDAPLLGLCEDSDLGSGPWFAPFGSAGLFSGQSVQEVPMMRAAVLNNLRVVFDTVSSLTSVFALHIDGTASTTVTMSPTSTGAIEDTIGSQSYADDEKGGFRFAPSAGSGTPLVVQCQKDTPETFLGNSNSMGFTTPQGFITFDGRFPTTAVSDEWDWRGGSSTAGNLSCYVSVAGSGTRTVSLRVAATNSTSVVISITGSGPFEDTTGSESVGDTDSVVLAAETDGDIFQLRRVTVELPWSSAAAPIPEQSFHEPAYQPRPLVRKVVASGPAPGYQRS